MEEIFVSNISAQKMEILLQFLVEDEKRLK